MALNIRESDEWKALEKNYRDLIDAVKSTDDGDVVVDLLLSFYHADVLSHAASRLSQECGQDGQNLLEAVLLHPAIPTRLLFSENLSSQFELVMMNPMFIIHIESQEEEVEKYLLNFYTRSGLVTRRAVGWILENCERPALLDFFSTILKEAGAPEWAMVPNPDPIKPGLRRISEAQREKWIRNLTKWIKDVRVEHQKKQDDEPAWTTYAILIFSMITNLRVGPKKLIFVSEANFRHDRVRDIFFNLFFRNNETLISGIAKYLACIQKIYSLGDMPMPRHPLVDILGST